MNEFTTISRYQVGALQRSTETADIYSGTDTVLNRSVWLRIFKEARIRDMRLRNQLSQSLQRMTELVHPHIAWIWETGEADGILFSVERSLSGEILSDYLTLDHRLLWEDAFRYFRHLYQAIQFAHSREIVHGDINPANVIISDDHGAVLMGFGMAQVFAGSTALTENDDQAGLARLLLAMVTGRIDPPALTASSIQWPFAVPPLAREPILRGLGLHPQGFYYNVEEFFESVEELSSIPQPDLTPAEIVQMQVEEDAYEKSFEAARQAREDAKRQEALAAARKEIGDEIQKALDEHLSIEEEPDISEQQDVVEKEVDLGQENGGSQETSKESQTPQEQPAEGIQTPDNMANDVVTPPVGAAEEKKQPEKSTKKRRKNLVYFILILILLVILAVLAWVWYQGGFPGLFPI